MVHEKGKRKKKGASVHQRIAEPRERKIQTTTRKRGKSRYFPSGRVIGRNSLVCPGQEGKEKDPNSS